MNDTGAYGGVEILLVLVYIGRPNFVLLSDFLLVPKVWVLVYPVSIWKSSLCKDLPVSRVTDLEDRRIFCLPGILRP